MLFWTIVKVGVKALWANKMRSFLAMLGIIIGVGAVIAGLAIGTGAKKQVLGRISAMGTNLLVITPGQSGSHGVVSGTVQNLTLGDAEALLSVPNVRRLAPVVDGRAQVKYANNNQPTRVTGSSPTYLPIRDYHLDKGRCFTETETDQQARVAVIGPATAEKLFGQNDPLDQVIKVKGINFTVIGVTKAKGDQGFFNPDDMIFVVYTTAMKQLFGLDYLREIDVQAADGSDLKKVQDDITALLRKRHRTQEEAAEDFYVRNQADFIQMATQVTQTFTFLLGGIAVISLLVGGIGIMNIMLVTVTERTREIGVRKAIGARENSILMQFLVEAVIVSGLGGLLGVALGVGAAGIIPRFSSMYTTYVEPWSVVLSLSVAGLVGVVFGLYPAWRAANLAPVDALRYE